MQLCYLYSFWNLIILEGFASLFAKEKHVSVPLFVCSPYLVLVSRWSQLPETNRKRFPFPSVLWAVEGVCCVNHLTIAGGPWDGPSDFSCFYCSVFYETVEQGKWLHESVHAAVCELLERRRVKPYILFTGCTAFGQLLTLFETASSHLENGNHFCFAEVWHH